MNEKSNFYVFERKEIFLVILFVILVAITSFLFGLKIGSSYSFESSGNSTSDQAMISKKATAVDFTSTEEEKVNELIKEPAVKEDASDLNKKIEESLKQKMINEFTNENKRLNAPAVEKPVAQVAPAPVQEVSEPRIEDELSQSSPSDNGVTQTDEFSGKYTINLASYDTVSEAKEFAEGFKALGYSPIINEAEVPGKGNRFRVSIGVFESISTAKDYILENKSLFAERDYFFLQFD